MTKKDAITRIKTLAAERGGRVSFDSFVSDQEIPAQRLRQEPWFAGWNALLSEIGLQTSEFGVARTPDDAVIASVATLIQKIRRWPTEDDYAREKKLNRDFPALQVIRRVKTSGKLLARLVEYSSGDQSYALVRSLAADRRAKEEPEQRLLLSGESAASELPTFGYVYLVQHGSRREYKVGRTSNPLRREGEVRIELPDTLRPIHYIETDDAAGVEAYWHNRFAPKRKEGEWFALTAENVRAFKKWKKII